MSYPSQPGDWQQQPGGWTDPAGPTQPFPSQPSDQPQSSPPQSGPPQYAAPSAPPMPPAPAGPMAPGYPAYGYPPAAPPTNSMALASMILSLVGIATCVCAPIGAILGHVALRQLRERGEGGESMAKAGIIVGWIVTGLYLLAIVGYVIFIIWVIGQAESSSTSGDYGY
ncbi:DUF4190 domain-containing protein [Plantactinospora sp. GCM10030261]|uniref:DUF4190 domain-containing protein n=1 Tax=Plantactinospora sp. GCM10030261 TaxID=3273420 RepID=UPI003612582F